MPTVVPDDGNDEDHRQRDHQRDAGAVEDARQDITAELVGAEEIHRRAVGGAEEVAVRRDQAEQPVAEALDEKAEIFRIGIIRADDRLEGDGVEFRAFADLIGARPDEVALLVGD
jgi:glycerol-3-phosphate O-acyltransferase